MSFNWVVSTEVTQLPPQSEKRDLFFGLPGLAATRSVKWSWSWISLKTPCLCNHALRVIASGMISTTFGFIFGDWVATMIEFWHPPYYHHVSLSLSSSSEILWCFCRDCWCFEWLLQPLFSLFIAASVFHSWNGQRLLLLGSTLLCFRAGLCYFVGCRSETRLVLVSHSFVFIWLGIGLLWSRCCFWQHRLVCLFVAHLLSIYPSPPLSRLKTFSFLFLVQAYQIPYRPDACTDAGPTEDSFSFWIVAFSAVESCIREQVES